MHIEMFNRRISLLWVEFFKEFQICVVNFVNRIALFSDILKTMNVIHRTRTDQAFRL